MVSNNSNNKISNKIHSKSRNNNKQEQQKIRVYTFNLNLTQKFVFFLIGIKDSEGVNFENQVLLNSKNKINYFPLYIKVSLIKKNENWNNERKGHLKGPTA